MKKLLLIPFCFILFTAYGQTRLTIQSPNEKCATVATNGRNNAFGDEGFWASFQTNGGSSFTIRSFLQFDLSSVPKGSFINWAKLTLFDAGLTFGPNIALLRRITSEWDPSAVTWNTQPPTASRGTIRLPLINDGQNLKNINVTNLVQNMVDSPSISFGFALRLDSDFRGANRSVLFISPIYGRSHYNPKLVLEYTVPGMQPAVTSMSVGLNEASTEMSIYPNPCNNAFNCIIKSTETDNLTLRVIDILGRTVYSQPVNTSSLQMRVSLPSSSAGTYFVILQDNKNTTLISQQLQVN